MYEVIYVSHAHAAFFDAVLAEVRRRRPPKTAIGKLYQDVKTWNRIRRERKDISLIIKRGEESWSFLKLKGGRTLDLSDFDEDWKLEMIEEYLMMPTRPRRHFWMPKNH